MSEHPLDCLHCSVLRQVEACCNSGYPHDRILGDLLHVIVTLVAAQHLNGQMIDKLADGMRETFVTGVRDFTAMAGTTVGHA